MKSNILSDVIECARHSSKGEEEEEELKKALKKVEGRQRNRWFENGWNRRDKEKKN
jgi:hypothetical protein